MVSLRLNRVNVGNSLTRWKPARRGGRRFRRRGGPRRRNLTLNFSTVSHQVEWGLSLVALKNNFWGLVHRRERLTWSTSAGALPGYAGSKRGRLQAAGAVASQVGGRLRRGPARPHRRGPPRSRRREGIFRRRPPRWARRGGWTRRRGRITTTMVHLVGWTRDKRWRYAVSQLNPQGRVWVQVRPRRVHNGLRGVKHRRC